MRGLIKIYTKALRPKMLNIRVGKITAEVLSKHKIVTAEKVFEFLSELESSFLRLKLD